MANFLTYFWCHDELFDVITNFSMSWCTSWHNDVFLISWETFWRHDVFLTPRHIFDVMMIFDVMTYFWCHDDLWRNDVFLTSWCNIDVTTNFLTYFWHYDELLTSWRTFSWHDVFLMLERTCWSHDELFDIMTYSWCHDVPLCVCLSVRDDSKVTSWIFFRHDGLFDVTTYSCHNHKLFYLMTYFWCHDVFDVMTHFLTSGSTSLCHSIFLWHHDKLFCQDVFLTSWQFFSWRNFLTSWRIYDVMTNFPDLSSTSQKKSLISHCINNWL